MCFDNLYLPGGSSTPYFTPVSTVFNTPITITISILSGHTVYLTD